MVLGTPASHWWPFCSEQLHRQHQIFKFSKEIDWNLHQQHYCHLRHGVSRLMVPCCILKLTQRQGLKKCQNSTFKVTFLCQKSTKFFRKIFSSKNINLGDHFLLKPFFSRLNFWTTLLSKIRSNFSRPPLYVNSQNTAIPFDYCWFLSKNFTF